MKKLLIVGLLVIAGTVEAKPKAKNDNKEFSVTLTNNGPGTYFVNLQLSGPCHKYKQGYIQKNETKTFKITGKNTYKKCVKYTNSKNLTPDFYQHNIKHERKRCIKNISVPCPAAHLLFYGEGKNGWSGYIPERTLQNNGKYTIKWTVKSNKGEILTEDN